MQENVRLTRTEIRKIKDSFFFNQNFERFELKERNVNILVTGSRRSVGENLPIEIRSVSFNGPPGAPRGEGWGGEKGYGKRGWENVKKRERVREREIRKAVRKRRPHDVGLQEK